MSLRAWSLLLLSLPTTAHAAEVVWLHAPANAEQSAQILALAEARGKGIPIQQLPGYAEAFQQDKDGAALDRLSASLRDVRMFEQRLDGELLIMRDLQPPLDAITLVPDAEAREQVFAALAYQGFAVDRFFEDNLAQDERAEAHRTTVDGTVVPSAWVDAIALQPDRAISAYEIAEAPQRAHYEAIRAKIGAALPGTLAAPSLPSGVALYIDGEPATSTDVIRVRPGRHFAHLVRNGQVVSRWSGRVEAGGRIELPLVPPDVAAAESWSAALPAPPPEDLLDDLSALGDEVWLVDPRGKGMFYAWDGKELKPVDTSLQAGRPPDPTPDEDGGVSVAVAVGSGWFANRDFYFQNPVEHEPTFQTVNAIGLVLSATAAVDVGGLRLEGGADGWWTPGAAHVARYGSNATNFRGFLHVAAGIPEARVAVGWLTPHHMGFGPRLTLPVGPVEVVGNGTFGVAVTPRNEDSTWKGTPIYSGWVGVGTRFGGSD